MNRYCHKILIRLVMPAVLFVAAAPAAFAALTLPAVISDHMVLQAGKPDAVWGWADPGDHVQVTLLDDSKTKTLAESKATAGSDGKWLTKLPILTAGTAGVLQVKTGKGEEKDINDVLVGEVWLGSGQSNMEYIIQAHATSPAVGEQIAKNMEVAQKEATDNKPALRYFSVKPVGNDEPQNDVTGKWAVADADNVGKCSAVAWNFAVALHESLHEPVGIIASSFGATPVEAWTPKEVLESIPAGVRVLQNNKERLSHYTPDMTKKYEDDLAAWKEANRTSQLQKQNRKAMPNEPYSPTWRKVPSRLYNAMIHGLEPYTIQGVIWFQLETVYPLDYSELICAMVKSWRERWGAELPFYYVEFENYLAPQKEPVEKQNYSILREQEAGVLELPKTGVAASIDLAMADEFTHEAVAHFPDKKDVGQRLAGMALADVYGIGDPSKVRSPEFSGYEIKEDKVYLHFKYADGLRLRGDALKGFAISGADGKWVWADGKIDGNDIVVWSTEIPKPVAVRYAWAINPIISVENGVSLPLRPFRTDKDK